MTVQLQFRLFWRVPYPAVLWWHAACMGIALRMDRRVAKTVALRGISHSAVVEAWKCWMNAGSSLEVVSVGNCFSWQVQPWVCYIAGDGGQGRTLVDSSLIVPIFKVFSLEHEGVAL